MNAKSIMGTYLPYLRECNPGVLLIFWVFRPRTVVYFGEKSAKITVFLADFSPKMTKVRPKYVTWGCIQDGVVFTRIRYIESTLYYIFFLFQVSWLDQTDLVTWQTLKSQFPSVQ